VSLQEGLDLGAKWLIAGTGLVEERRPLGRRDDLDRREENGLFRFVLLCHGTLVRQRFV
jgi:hypothetical protein